MCAVRDAAVVAPKERQEILREIALVLLGQRAHDAEVQRDVLAAVRRVDGDENVARVHVGVKEAVAKHLGEKDLDAGARQPLDVDALLDAGALDWLIGVPSMRCMTMTSLLHQSQ